MRIEQVRSDLVTRLRLRREEIEQAALTRTKAVADPREAEDPSYAQGLRAAVSAAVEYGIDALERREDKAPPIPTTLLSQARLAARSRIPLDMVLRRYFAGYTLLGDFVIEEADRSGFTDGTELKRLLRVQASLFDRLIAAITEEYGREAMGPSSTEERRAELAKRLLDGELADTAELTYELERWHLGAMAVGETSLRALRGRLTARLDCQVLAIPRKGEASWLWLGSRSPLEPGAVLSLLSQETHAHIALGEPGEGIEGWRLTHRQAAAALPIAQQMGRRSVRYRDVSLVASAIEDDLLVASLRQMYLRPLEEERDGGEVIRQSLRAYFTAERNASSAAAALGISRQALAKRLRLAEARVGQPLADCGMELEAALRLESLTVPTTQAEAAVPNDPQPLAPHRSHIDTD